MKTIEIFGDSVLKGVIYDGAQNKYRLCKDKIAVEGMEIRNHCRMGATVCEGLKMIDRRLADCNADTVAVIELGGNDCNYRWEEISAHPTQIHHCAVEPDRFTHLLKQGIRKLQSTGATVVLSSLVPLYAPRFMDFITRGLCYESILSWLGDVERLFRWQDYYNDLVTETARQTGCALMDLRQGFLTKHYETRLCEDGIHPTQQGHIALHHMVEDYLQKAMA